MNRTYSVGRVALRTLFSTVLFAVGVCAPLKAAESGGGYTLSASGTTGIWVGTTEELVYLSASGDRYLSQLVWQMFPLVHMGMDLALTPSGIFERGGFYAGLSGRFAIPGTNSGVMQDSDWVIMNNPSYRTNFSEHDNITNSAVNINASAGWSFPISGRFALRPYLNFSYRYFSFSAQDGYARYEIISDAGLPSGTFNNFSIYGEGITYKQSFHSLAPGVSFTTKLGDKVALECFANVGWVIKYEDEDIHIFRNEKIGTGITSSGARVDIMSSGIQFQSSGNLGLDVNAGVKLDITPMEKLDLRLFASYAFSKVRSDSRYRNQSQFASLSQWDARSYGGNGPGTGGGILSLFEFGFALRVSL